VSEPLAQTLTPPVEHRLELAVSPEEAVAAVERALEDWGGRWERGGGTRGSVQLPVVAGLRYGSLRGDLQVAPRREGAEVILRIEEEIYHLQTQAVGLLGLSALGALTVVVWPFFPQLSSAAPLGAILALSGWFLVVSRLRTSGVEELFDLVSALSEGMDPSEVPTP
jgi:hypothetical protein